MKKRPAILVSLTLSAALAAGCAAAPAGSGPASSPAPPASPAPQQPSAPAASSKAEAGPSPFDGYVFNFSQAHYNAAEEWQRQYYDKAIELLEADSENTLFSVNLFYASGTPYVAFISHLAPEGNSGAINRRADIYTSTADGISQVYSGAIRSEEINTLSGNMVVTTSGTLQLTPGEADERVVQTTDETLELTPGGTLPLYSHFSAYTSADGATVYGGLYQDGALTDITLYNNAESRYYTDLETYVLQPERTLPLDGPSEQLLLRHDALPSYPSSPIPAEVTKSRISDFFLGTYQPRLPAGAPQWVTKYMQYIRVNYLFSYIPHKHAGNAPFQVSLLAAGISNQPPVLYSTLQSVFGAHTLCHNGHTTTLANSNDYLETPVADSTGKILVRISSYQSVFYYSLHDTGMHYLYGAGPIHLNSTPNRPAGTPWYHLNGEAFDSGAENAPAAYDLPNLNAYLPLHGYSLPIQELTPTGFAMPQAAAWETLEPALIDFMCAYARDNGYM